MSRLVFTDEGHLDVLPEAVHEVLTVNEYLMDNRPYYFQKMDKEALAVLLQLPCEELDKMGTSELRQKISSKKASEENVSEGLITENCEKVAAWLGLNRQESKLLKLAVLCHQASMLASLLREVSQINYRGCLELIARVIGEPSELIAKALEPGSSLRRAGLFSASSPYASGRDVDPTDLLDLQDAIAPRINQSSFSAEILLNDVATNIAPADLTVSDFEHIEADVDILVRLLNSAKKSDTAGVNILLYGPSGVGKSELAAVLANAADTKILAVASQDADGDPISSTSRRACYLMLQYLAQKTAADAVLLDEAEDLFDLMKNSAELFSGLRSAPNGGRNKAWWNQLLETNQLPTIWVSNSIAGLDPAYLRRFQYVLELTHPPLASRKRIIQRCIEGLPLSDFAITSAAKNEQLSAGNIKSAANLVRYVGSKSPETMSGEFLRTLNGKLTAMDHKKLKLSAPKDKAKLIYSLDYLNTSSPIDNIAKFLGKHKEGRLLFYGAPGTGKSEFSRYLAKSLDVRLDVKRTSDILSMWHGGTEKNLARIFSDEDADNRFVLIDEVDSLLFDRASVEKSWIVSGINEFLSQLESYPGMVACTTNRLDALDPAVLRRFDLKVKFKALRNDQVQNLLTNVLNDVGLKLGTELEQCQPLTGLTPGDIAAVKRAHRLSGGDWTTAEWLERVAGECRIKPKLANEFIGFGADALQFEARS